MGKRLNIEMPGGKIESYHFILKGVNVKLQGT
jgi:hypothetical protein